MVLVHPTVFGKRNSYGIADLQLETGLRAFIRNNRCVLLTARGEPPKMRTDIIKNTNNASLENNFNGGGDAA